MSSSSSSLDFSKKQSLHSSYQIRRTNPLNNQTSAPLLTSSPSLIQFTIPTGVVNLAQTRVKGQINFSAAPASSYNYNWKCGISPVQRARLSVAGGDSIALIEDLNMFTRMTKPITTKVQDFITMDQNKGYITALAVRDSGAYFAKSNVATLLASPANALVANNCRPAAVTLVNEAADMAVTEPQYIGTSASASAHVVKFDIPLADLMPSTLCTLDKSMYFGQPLLLEVSFNSIDRMGWQGTDDGDFSSAPLPMTSSATVTNLTLNIANETNPAVISGLMNKVNSGGMEILTPYVISQKKPIATSTHNSFVYRVDSSYGDRLLNVYSSLANATPTGIFTYDISNSTVTSRVPGARVTSFQSSINNNALQTFRPVALEFEDYSLMEPLLKDSVAGQSSNVWNYNRCWVDSFRKGPCVSWKDADNNNEVDGMDLSEAREYQMQYDTPSLDHIQYFYFVVQRTLSISPSGQVTWKGR